MENVGLIRKRSIEDKNERTKSEMNGMNGVEWKGTVG